MHTHQLFLRWTILSQLLCFISVIAGLCSASPADARVPWRTGPPVVVVLDGINFRASLFGGAASEGYIADAFISSWPATRCRYSRGEVVCDDSSDSLAKLFEVPWSGNLREAEDILRYISLAKGLIRAVVEDFSSVSAIVILGHSWGSVVAYRSLLELSGEIPSNALDALVTLGSPLTTDSLLILFSAPWLGGVPGGEFVLADELSKPSTVRNWLNYYSQCDQISGSVVGAGSNLDYWPSGYGASCAIADWVKYLT